MHLKVIRIVNIRKICQQKKNPHSFYNREYKSVFEEMVTSRIHSCSSINFDHGDLRNTFYCTLISLKIFLFF